MASSIIAGLQGKAFHLFLNLSFFMLLALYLSSHLSSSMPFLPRSYKLLVQRNPSPPLNDHHKGCNGLSNYESYREKCTYTMAESDCNPEGYINYLYIFYCICGKYPVLGFAILILWLILLFYLLGNTTARYFCSNLEGLSKSLKLPPTLAGVTLLSLGNGAPDVFSTVVSFLGNSTSDVGLNGVLGGAFFVSSVVVGTISICVSPRAVSIDRSSFIRDVCFLLLVLIVLLAILAVGEISVWGAAAFTSLYAVYALLVSFAHLRTRIRNGEERDLDEQAASPLPACKSSEIREDLGYPLLVSIEVVEPKKDSLCSEDGSLNCCFGRFLRILDLPLYLPRRLTIPDVCKERWSKPYAVISVALAPILLVTLWDSKWGEVGSGESFVIYLFGVLAGLVFCIAAAAKTRRERPPTRFLFPWLAAGFLMSVVWTYIVAEELVSLLVSLGAILGISPSVLGLTVLAWGNSLGDLIANLAVALNGGPGGAQVAMSGCYGGPIFNTLVGLGLSLVLSAWAGYPSPCALPEDHTLFQTLGFLIAGLLWTLVILPRRGMRPDRVLGCGLLCIYLCFLSIRLCQSLGFLQLQ